MDLLKTLRLIRLRDNIFRLIPLIILIVSFFYTAKLLEEKTYWEQMYSQEVSKVNVVENHDETLKEMPNVDTSSLEILLFIGKDFNYSKVEVDVDKVIFEFQEDALFETKGFEETLNNNDYEYSIQVAQGDRSWNGIRVEVKL